MPEIDPTVALISVGALFLVGLATDWLGRRTPLPRVTLLLLFGILIGPSALDILPHLGNQWFPVIANMALCLVGFLLGEKLTISAMRWQGKEVLWISLAEVVVTGAVVFVGLVLLGLPVELALILAGISPATDPAATSDVVHESEADGQFTRTLLGIVAVDDAWGLIAFSFTLLAAQFWLGHAGAAEIIGHTVWELGGAALVGIAIGIPAAYFSGRIRPGEPTLVEALGIVFLCGGIALWLEVSFLLSAMILGATIANLGSHHTRPFHAIESIGWPFMILFFVLAGASLDVGTLPSVGVAGTAYVIFRVLGRLGGGLIGGRLCGADVKMRRWMGPALLPQAGVAMGMALVASQRFPEYSDVVLPVAIGATVLFEIAGPILTRRALKQVGDAGALEKIRAEHVEGG